MIWGFSSFSGGWRILLGAGVVLIFAALSYGDKKKNRQVDPKFFKQLAEASSYSSLIKQYLKIVIFYGGILTLLSIPTVVFMRLDHNPFYTFFAIFLVAGWIYWLSVVADGVVTLFGALFMFLARYFVEGGKWLMWRIASYPKGPLTAILTLSGAGLAVLKLIIGK